MQTEFPEGYEGMFFISFDKHGGSTRHAGVVVAKRTYSIIGGMLIPETDMPVPIFMQDVPYNRVLNSDFTGELDDKTWKPDDSIVLSIADPESEDARLIVQQASGSSGRVIQPLTFAEPLGGREFHLRFQARGASGSETITNVQLEADGEVICQVSRSLSTSWQTVTTGSLSIAARTFSDAVSATEMRLVLRGGDSTGDTVEYDRVQVEEQHTVTGWNSATTLRYESDLVPVKQHIDVVVLGNAVPFGTWQVSVKPYWGDGNPEPVWEPGMVWLERPAGFNQKAMFGWQPRDDGESSPHRQSDTGTFSENGDDYPPEWPDPSSPARNPLPADFSNRFFNGQWREIPDVLPGIPRVQSPPLDARARVRVDNSDGTTTFQLNGDLLAATLYTGDEEVPTAITMLLDTLVIEPEQNRCYLVWRGSWDYDAIPEADYRRLTVQTN